MIKRILVRILGESLEEAIEKAKREIRQEASNQYVFWVDRQSFISNEEFIDQVVERINKKQLKCSPNSSTN